MEWADRASVVAPGAVVAERFVIEHLVARGGMGMIFRAKDSISNQPVALKILSRNAEHPVEAERFEREASLLSRLSHPRIVAHVAHGETADGYFYLVMEWLEGHDLRRRLAKGPLTPRKCKMLLEKVAEALSEIHAHGIVHRDVKPANIFLRSGKIEDPVLVDFGIARGGHRTTELTRTGTAVGTPDYMSPEQARGLSQIGSTSDIFSLGCVGYVCLTGAPPFASDHVTAVLAKILFDRPKPVNQIRPSVSQEFSDLIARMLRKDPSARPQSAGELLRELSRIPDGTVQVLDTATVPETETETSIIPPPNSDVVESEQALVSVVLCLPGPAAGSQDTPTSDRFNSIKMQLIRFGVDIDQMIDGSLVATIVTRGSAVDQVRIAARSALFLRDSRQSGHISIATGRGRMQGTLPVGEAVDRAAGLLRIAEPLQGAAGMIVIDEVTAGLLGPRFETKTLQPGLFSLTGERLDVDTGRLLLGRPTPCVGREAELSQLQAIWRHCAEGEGSNAVVLQAPPGMGKSRIRLEFTRRLLEKYPETRVLVGFGDPLSVGSPYGLLGQALRNDAGIQAGSPDEEQRAKLREGLCASLKGDDRQRVAEFLGELCSVPFPAEESPMLLAARRDPKAMSEQIKHAFLDFMTAECEKNPMVMMLEDLQWGDALTIQLIGTVLREKSELSLLILAFARPELAEAYPSLWQGRAQEIPLRPLSKKVCERYTEEMLGEQKLSPEALAKLVQRSEGNPLFLEELIRAASEGRTEEVPETVLAMMQARLSSLAPEARKVLRSASTFGETFWAGGVRGILGDTIGHSTVLQWLHVLIKSEWIEQRRHSRFEKEVEFAFRHAIAHEAAYSLLAESELEWAHRQAFLYLEGVGERDCIVLAGHARAGKLFSSAADLYARAAEESLMDNDLAEAKRRAAMGMECGPEGEQKGVLHAIMSIAAFGLTDWRVAEACGSEALELLPRGHRYWFQLAENLVQIFPTTGRIDRFEKIVGEIETIQALPDARPAQISAMASLIAMFGMVGDRARARQFAGRIEQVKGTLLDSDPYVKGVVHLYMAYDVHFWGSDPYAPLIHGQEGERMFVATRVLHRLSFVRGLIANVRGELGDYAGAEEAAKSAIELAGQIHDPYLVAIAKMLRAHYRVRVGALETLDESAADAKAVLDASMNQTYGAMALTVMACAHLRRGQLEDAVQTARSGCQLSAVWPHGFLACTSVLADALAEAGRFSECLSALSEGLAVLRRLGDVNIYGIRLRAAAADGYLRAGKREEGIALLRETLQEMDKRANKIEDPFLKNCYLHQNIDNLRVFKLARQWIPEDI